MIAITFSLPDESRDFLLALRVTRRRGRGVGSAIEGALGGVPVVVWHIGVGAQRAATEAARLLAEVKPTLVLCAGYGGALEEGMALGDLVVDRRGSAVALPPDCREGKIQTVAKVAETVGEKRRLGTETGALCVDMETEVLARVFEPAGVRLIGVRAISDRLEDPLPVPMAHWFDLVQQRPRVLALLTYLASHPGRIAPFYHFVRGLAPARAALAGALVGIIEATVDVERPA